MSTWTKFLTIVGIVCAVLNPPLQFVERDSFGDSIVGKWWATFLHDERLWLTVAFSLITALLAFGAVFFKPIRAQRDFRESLIDGIYETVLDNDRRQARITIFKDVGFWGTLWRRVKDFFGLRKRGWTLGRICRYCWNANYIKIMSRWGTEFKNSKTYFCVNKSTATECQGVAGQVRQREEEIVVQLPRLDGIDLNAVDESHEVVRDYMRAGHIGDFGVLRSLNRHAPYIYGNIISARGGRKKFVLVVDSWAALTTPFHGRNRKILSRYVKQISATFGT